MPLRWPLLGQITTVGPYGGHKLLGHQDFLHVALLGLILGALLGLVEGHEIHLDLRRGPAHRKLRARDANLRVLSKPTTEFKGE